MNKENIGLFYFLSPGLTAMIFNFLELRDLISFGDATLALRHLTGACVSEVHSAEPIQELFWLSQFPRLRAIWGTINIYSLKQLRLLFGSGRSGRSISGYERSSLVRFRAKYWILRKRTECDTILLAKELAKLISRYGATTAIQSIAVVIPGDNICPHGYHGKMEETVLLLKEGDLQINRTLFPHFRGIPVSRISLSYLEAKLALPQGLQSIIVKDLYPFYLFEESRHAIYTLLNQNSHLRFSLRSIHCDLCPHFIAGIKLVSDKRITLERVFMDLSRFKGFDSMIQVCASDEPLSYVRQEDHFTSFSPFASNSERGLSRKRPKEKVCNYPLVEICDIPVFPGQISEFTAVFPNVKKVVVALPAAEPEQTIDFERWLEGHDSGRGYCPFSSLYGTTSYPDLEYKLFRY